MDRTRTFIYWTAPSLLCLMIYWYGFRAWFQMDDFAWLALHLQVHDWRSFLDAMFRPFAQGTIRPWSERLFFMSGMWLFGMEAAPYRAVVFATQFANLVLIAALVRRMTGSALAGFLAPVLWVCNGNIYQPLSWTSAYNQVQCSTFLLLALGLFLRFIETGRRRYYYAQIVVFVLGFGSLELNVVYPAIAALYALCCARQYLKATLPLFLLSGIYAVIHRSVAQKDPTDIYLMVWDSSILRTFFTYLKWSFGADRIAELLGYNTRTLLLLEILTAAALLLFAITKLRQKNWLAAFFPGWFFITIALYLPLRNHVTDYYLTIPTIGLAMLGGWAVAECWRRRGALRWIAVVAALLYAGPSVREARYYTRHNYDMSQRVKNFLQRVAYAYRRSPDKAILVDGVDSDLFWTGWYDTPFQVFGLRDIFMTEETEPSIRRSPYSSIGRHFLPSSIASDLLRRDKAIVYRVEGNRLRNITDAYSLRLGASGPLEPPRLVKIGSPLYQSQMGVGWYNIEDHFRWMTKRGTLRIRGPRQRDSTLSVTGTGVPEQVAKQPLFLTVSVEGKAFPPSKIDASNLRFDFTYPLPPELVGKPEIQVALEVDRTTSTPQDQRQFGLVVDVAEVQP